MPRFQYHLGENKADLDEALPMPVTFSLEQRERLDGSVVLRADTPHGCINILRINADGSVHRIPYAAGPAGVSQPNPFKAEPETPGEILIEGARSIHRDAAPF